uniref:Transmembrane protein n=1 Tax=Steinernema glaseri TaxID=37863 RepID=A0A1I7YLG7_9BILA
MVSEEEEHHRERFQVTICGKKANIEDIARPAAVLSLFIFISLSVLASIHLGWGILFTMMLGFAVYGLLFGALFFRKCVHIFLALFVCFELFKICILISALVLAIVSLSEHYSDLNLRLIIFSSIYLPMNLVLFLIFYKYYKLAKANEERREVAVRRDVEAPSRETDSPPNYKVAVIQSQEDQRRNSQLPAYEDVVTDADDPRLQVTVKSI